MPALVRLCPAVLALAACPGSPDVRPAPDPAQAAEPAATPVEEPPSPADPASLRASPAWQVGNWWLYEADQKPGDDPGDESPLPSFRMLREVVKVEPKNERELRVTVRQQGGSYVDHSLVLVVSDTCVQVESSGHKIYCISPDTGPGEVLPGPLKLRIHQYANPPFVTAFDPEVGIVSNGNVGRANRTSSTILVGFQVGDRVEGEPKEEPLGCALDRTEAGVGTWSSPEGYSLEVRKEASMAGTTVTLARMADGKRVEHTHEVAGAAPGKVSIRLIPDADRCVLRIQSTHGDSPKIADLDVTSAELPKIRGSLVGEPARQGQ